MAVERAIFKKSPFEVASLNRGSMCGGRMIRLILRIAFFYLVVVLFGSTFSKAEENIGTVAGSFDVSLSGSSTYSIPIKAPSGASGMEPKLTLSYDSQSSAGSLGAGWSITGLSTITRSPRNLFADGVITGVQLLDSDALLLDGQRLVVVKVEGSGASKRTEFRKETDDQSEIVQIGDTLSISKFIVRTKGGITLLFDGENESRVKVTGGETLLLSVSRIFDTSGNFIQFEYRSSGSGDYDISRVLYTAQGSVDASGNVVIVTPPFAKIEFQYQSTSRPIESYVTGRLIRRDSRLISIESSIIPSSPGLAVAMSRYELEYLDRPTTSSRFVLKTVRQVGMNGDKLAPTTFTYSEPSIAWKDAPYSLPIGVAYALREKLAGAYRFAKFAEGLSTLPDLLVSAQINGKLESFAFKNDAGVFTQLDKKFNPPVAFVDSDGADLGALIIDVDGDGRSDIIQSQKPKDQPSQSKAFLAESSGWTEQANYALPFDLSIDGNRAAKVLVAKLTGGTGPDLIFQAQSGSGFFKNGGKGVGWLVEPALKPPVRIDRFAKLHDVDCDGVPELISIVDNAAAASGWEWRVFRFSPGGWIEETRSEFRPAIDASVNPSAIRTVSFLPNALSTPSKMCVGLMASSAEGIGYRAGVVSTPAGWVSVKAEFIPTFDLVTAAGEVIEALVVDLKSRGADDVIAGHIAANAQVIQFAYQQTTEGWVGSLSLPPILSDSQKGAFQIHPFVGDLNGDQFVDIVLPGGTKGGMARLFAGGLAGFEEKPDFSPPIPFARTDLQDRGIRFVDLNNDGLPDLIFSRETADKKADPLSRGAFLNTGQGWFEIAGLVPEVAFAGERITGSPVEFVDVDGDGFVDMLYSYRRADGSVQRSFFKNSPCATSGDEPLCGSINPSDPSRRRKWLEIKGSPFTPPNGFPFAAENIGDLGVRLVDLNGDGRVDLVASTMLPTTGGIAASGVELCPTPPPGALPAVLCPIDPKFLRSATWINDGTGFVQAPAEFNSPLPFVIQIASTNERTSDAFVQLVDLDGDRLPDLIASFTHPSQTKPIELTYRNTGSGWHLVPNLKAPIALDTGSKTASGVLQWADINGDGLQDIIYTQRLGGTNQSATYLSTGAGFSQSGGWQIPVSAIADRHGDPSFRLIDLNGDGLLDIVYARKTSASTTERGVFVNNGAGFSVDSILAGDPTLIEKIPAFIDENGFDQGVRIVDVDGNGLVDIIQSLAVGPSNVIPAGPVLLSAGRRSDILEKIDTGSGVVTTLSYQALLENTFENGGDHAPWRRVYSPGEPDAFPIINPIPASYVVRRAIVHEEGGASTPFSYRYGNFRIHGLAMKPLGFGWRESFNELSDIVGRVEIKQDVRVRGVPTREATCLVKLDQLPGTPIYFSPLHRDTTPPSLCPEKNAGVETPWTALLNETKSKWKVREETVSVTGLPNQTLRQVSIEEIGQRSYEFNDAGELTSQIDIFTHDEPSQLLLRRMNVLQVESRRGEGTGTTTTNQYSPDDTLNWIFGRLVRTTVVKTGDGLVSDPFKRKREVRSAEFEYSPKTGLLSVEITDAHSQKKAVTTRYERDYRGNVVSKTTKAPGEAERRSSIEFDSLGRFPIRETNALGHAEHRVVRIVDGQPDAIEGPNGLTTRFEYDGFGRKKAEITPSGLRTTNETLSLDKLDSRINLSGVSASYASVTRADSLPPTIQLFDVKGRVVRSVTEGFTFDDTVARFIYKDTQYDSLGRPRRTSVPYELGQIVRWSEIKYDEVGRVWNASAVDGTTITTRYKSRSGGGSVLCSADALDGVSCVEKNMRGLPTKIIDAKKGVVTYEYDAGDRLEVIIGANGAKTSYTFDEVGQKVLTQDPDLGVWRYEYDAFGKLKLQQDAKGQVTLVEYDLLGRPTRKAKNDAATWWEYDSAEHGVGKPTSMRASDGYREDYFYDELGRPRRTAVTIGAESFSNGVEYDQFSRVTKVDYPTGFSVSNVFDSRGFQIEVRDTKSKALYWKALNVDQYGRVTQENFGNGVNTRNTFDEDTGRLRRIRSDSEKGPTVFDLTLNYDLLGNLKDRSEAVENIAEVFQYDALYRLTSAKRAGGPADEYKYDESGRFTFKSGTGSFTYTNAPKMGDTLDLKPFHAVQSTISGREVKRYEYDENGNLVRGPKGSFEYTADNRLRLMFADQFRWIRFDYNPDGNRYRQFWRTGIEATETLYVQNYERVTEYAGPLTDARRGRLVRHRHSITNGSGTFAVVETNNEYADIVGEVPAPTILGTRSIIGNTKVWYVHRDQLGSIIRLTDESGRISAKFWYDPWGKRVAKINDRKGVRAGQTLDDSWDRGFTGHEHIDDYSAIHMNGRVYDYTIASFTSVDIANQSIGDSQTGNGYQYAKRNPLRFVDPSGYFSLGKLGRAFLGGAVGFLLGGPAGAIAGVLYATSPDVKKFVDDNWRTAVIIGVTVAVGVVTGPGGAFAMNALLAGAVVGATSAGLSAALYGGSFDEVLVATAKGAVIGAVTAGFFDAAGTAFDGSSAALGAPDSIGAVAAHGAVGGLMEVANEGDFWKGFAAAAVTKAANAFGPNFEGATATARLGNTVKSALIAGTSAQITGGKFANGAITGAFSYLFNDARHEEEQSRLEKFAADLPDLPAWASDGIQGFGSGASFGLTDRINKRLGVGGFVNEDSLAYTVGSVGGNITSAFYPAAAMRGMAYLGSLGKEIRALRWINSNRYLRFGYTKVPDGPFTYGSTYVKGTKVGPVMRFTNEPAWWNHWDLRVLGR